MTSIIIQIYALLLTSAFLILLQPISVSRRTKTMTAPKKHPYNRRPRKSDPKRQCKRSATENPYLFIPDKPATPEPKPKNEFRSVAQRKPVPPAQDFVKDHRQIRDKPIDFANSVLSVRPWDKQQQILHAIANKRSVAVRSCNGAGKTFTAVITTAHSERQVREIFWRELRNLYMPVRDIGGGKLTRTRLELSPKRYAYGFSTNTEDRFQGFHPGNILVIVDEASGVDEFIYTPSMASPPPKTPNSY